MVRDSVRSIYPYTAFTCRRGFSLVEVMMVMAILGVLMTIGVKAYTENRAKTYDTQVAASIRNLLTMAATELPDVADVDNWTTVGYVEYYDDFEMGDGMRCNVAHDTDDRWMFFLAHVGGDTGFYFWLPGEDCSANDDGSGNWSDTIYKNSAYRTNVGL